MMAMAQGLVLREVAVLVLGVVAGLDGWSPFCAGKSTALER